MHGASGSFFLSGFCLNDSIELRQLKERIATMLTLGANQKRFFLALLRGSASLFITL